MFPVKFYDSKMHICTLIVLLFMHLEEACSIFNFAQGLIGPLSVCVCVCPRLSSRMFVVLDGSYLDVSGNPFSRIK